MTICIEWNCNSYDFYIIKQKCSYIIIPSLGFKPSKYHSSLNSGALRFTHIFIKKKKILKLNENLTLDQLSLLLWTSTPITFENELLKVKTNGVWCTDRRT